MPPLIHGLIAGMIFGLASAISMLPMKFADKPAALWGAFSNRFGIGLLIPLVRVGLPTPAGWLVGALVGLLLSLPSAIVTRAYAPILIVGGAGGAVIGLLT